MSKQVVILAAGMGTRLARPLPKPLTELRDGRSIMKQQFDNIDAAFGETSRVMIVVGFKLEAIIERFPEATFVYNEFYDQTNTSKSLLKALRASGDGGVLWLNGDVVFDPQVLVRVTPMMDANQSFVVVNTAKVSDEEVKYTLDSAGQIAQLSKQVIGGLGEAVGINYVAAQDKAALIKRLAEVDDTDYFERGIELAIAEDGLKFQAVDISDLYAVEVDFAEDLARANEVI
ncbi:NTP transferase domain-containing protein [Rhodoluna limnophila]|uniref:phosphocholine cytidylyltransferase family protein n=1 Tax=Rhodoluna limnophila TaxID=232537 RepID=UPI001106D4DA|nr:phosphocholine cytidylyltransferase family protein [Rhodoluna limnophila]